MCLLWPEQVWGGWILSAAHGEPEADGSAVLQSRVQVTLGIVEMVGSGLAF